MTRTLIGVSSFDSVPVVQMTAIMLNHMYSNAPADVTAEALDKDYIILDWLKANGHLQDGGIDIGTYDEADNPGAGDHGTKIDWHQDFQDCLLRSTVGTLHAPASASL